MIIVFLTITTTVTSFATTDEGGYDDGSDNEEWSHGCYDSGYKAGQNGPFSQDTYDHCGDEIGGDDAYYLGFIDSCMSVEGNTRDVCESATDA